MGSKLELFLDKIGKLLNVENIDSFRNNNYYRESSVLRKYNNYFENITQLSSNEFEELIIFLGNEVIDWNFDNNGLVASFIKLLRKAQLHLELTKKEIDALKKAESKSYMLPHSLYKNPSEEDNHLETLDSLSDEDKNCLLEMSRTDGYVLVEPYKGDKSLKMTKE